MIPIVLAFVALLAGCASQQTAPPSGPASLQLVHPDYYSQHPPRLRYPAPGPGKKPRYLPPETADRSETAQDGAILDDIPAAVDEAARALDKLQTKLRNDIR